MYWCIGVSVCRCIGVSVYQYSDVSVYRCLCVSVCRFIGGSMYYQCSIDALSMYNWYIGKSVLFGVLVCRCSGEK